MADERPDRGGLPRAVRAEEPEHAAGRHFEVEPGQGGDGAVPLSVDLADVAELDDRARARRTRHVGPQCTEGRDSRGAGEHNRAMKRVLIAAALLASTLAGVAAPDAIGASKDTCVHRTLVLAAMPLELNPL